jgi:hypothetical protein
MSAMRTSLRTVAVLAVLLTAANGQSLVPSENPKPSFGIHAAETGGGLLGGLGLGFAAALAEFYIVGPNDPGPQMTRILVVGVPFGVVGLAGGTTLVGSAFHQQGKFWPTLAWSAGSVAAGLALAAGGFYLGNNDVGPIGSLAPVVVAIGLAAPPILTTVGYNRSRSQNSFGSRFVPGSVGLASVRDAEGIAHPSLNVRLLSVRF